MAGISAAAAVAVVCMPCDGGNGCSVAGIRTGGGIGCWLVAGHQVD